MQIVNFTPFSALMGGLLIGISAALLLLLHGKIAGISGIISGLFTKPTADWIWRIMTLLGMLGGAALFRYLQLGPDSISISSNSFKLILGGLLVGIGAVVGSGCTSGHGICGVARISSRSIVATAIFISTAILTVLLQKAI